MSHKYYEDPVLADSAEIVEDTPVEEEVKELIGIVSDCLKLNVRKEPRKDSEVVAIVNCLNELKIDLDTSTDDWYAVCTAAGIEGFCMKQFVNLIP